MRCLVVFVCSLLVLGCADSKKDTVQKIPDKTKYDLYEPSEMALLMNAMFDYNMELKNAIKKGETPTSFPIDFLKIHSAQLTKASDRNDNFENFSKLFIQKQEAIFNQDSEVSVKDRFNAAVNVCISCHETSCTGPIPRIKKLLIN